MRACDRVPAPQHAPRTLPVQLLTMTGGRRARVLLEVSCGAASTAAACNAVECSALEALQCGVSRTAAPLPLLQSWGLHVAVLCACMASW